MPKQDYPIMLFSEGNHSRFCVASKIIKCRFLEITATFMAASLIIPERCETFTHKKI